ncbi:septation protein SepH [Aeromicrobium sp. Sec7.5]|uniref:septation protein SepH n=1 Tax=Aeromicrobium sp. Sec7.5 TaxID=3121276 RepID=UPI002FE4515B
MRELGPDRLSDDGNGLVARDPASGEEFRVPIDDRLSRLVALAEQRRPSGQAARETTRPRETTMSNEPRMQSARTESARTESARTESARTESALSPREIQTRIRRGETVSEVADAAGVPATQIEGFATPVLAERAYMAEQARATPLRRKHVGGAPVALGELVDGCLAATGFVPDDAAWDAWRREDGRWAVIVTPRGEPAAHFVFDVKSRYVLPADDGAHGLVGDVAHPDESSDMALADAVRSGEVRADDERSGEEPVLPAAQVVAEDYAISAPVASLKEARDRRALEQMAQAGPASPGSDHPTDQLDFSDLEDEHAEEARASTAQPAPEESDHQSGPDAEPEPEAEAETSRPEDRRKHERRRVPSWDEIMFGGRDA